MAANQSRQAVAAKVRARYGRFFTPANYASLAASPGLSEFTAQLRSHPDFSELLGTKDRDPRGASLRRLLRWHMYEDLASLFRFDSFLGSPMVQMVSRQLTVELIISFVRHCNAGTLARFHPTVPDFFQNHLSLDFAALLKAENYNQLIALFGGHPFMKVLAANIPSPGKPVNLTALEYDLMKEYYEEMFQLFQTDPKGYGETKEIFSMMVDLDNLQKLLRTKRYYLDQKEAPAFFLGGYITTGQLTEWNRLSYDQIIQQLQNTRYGTYIDPQFPPDFWLRRMLYHQCKKNIRTKTGVSDLLTSYFILSRTRRECLTIIYEGVAYGMTPDAIMALLPIC